MRNPDDYARFRERMKQLSAALKPRPRADGLRLVLRQLRGRKYRAARKVIKRQLGWHQRWQAEAFIALNPWQTDLACRVWADLSGR